MNRPQGIPYVYTDNTRIARLGAEHLLACGFEQLAFCGLPRTRVNGWVAERASAFAAACREAGRACDVFAGQHATARRWQDLQRQLCEWLGRLPKPVGIMACNDVRARHVLEACRSLGLVVPRDVAVLGVDNDEVMCELTDPPLSSIDQSARRIGYEAAAVLDRLIRRAAGAGSAAGPPRQTVIPPIGVVARASTDTMATADETVQLVLERLRTHPWERPDVAALAARGLRLPVDAGAPVSGGRGPVDPRGLCPAAGGGGPPARRRDRPPAQGDRGPHRLPLGAIHDDVSASSHRAHAGPAAVG